MTVCLAMPYDCLSCQEPWEIERPIYPTLFAVVRIFSEDDNDDIAWKDTVTYLSAGTVVLYVPEDASDADIGWWKVWRITGVKPSRAGWVHPGTLAHISGEIHVSGNSLRYGFETTKNRMSCHSMGAAHKPSDADLVHTGWCPACQTRMASHSSYTEHVLLAIQLLKDTKTLEIYCKRGKHRSLALGVLLVSLTHCITGSGFNWRCEARSPCSRISSNECARILLNGRT